MFMEMKKQKFKNLYALMKADLHQWCKKTNKVYSFRAWMLFFIKNPAFRRLLDYRIKTSGIKILKLFRPFTFFSSLHLNLLILSDKSTKGIGGGIIFYSWLFNSCILQINGRKLSNLPTSNNW